MEKNKFVAMVLTVILPGLGYIYLGKKMIFGLMLLIAGIGNLIWHYSTPYGFELSPFLIASVVGYYGAILMDTFYTAKTDKPVDTKAATRHEERVAKD